MNIKTIECFKVNIPFQRKFVISHSARKHSESVFVNVALGNGILGWGESLPRPYVTGERQESVVKVLNKVYIPVVKKWDIKSYDEVINRLKALKTSRETNCALCALEIALLDAFGKHFDKSVRYVFGGVKNTRVIYSGAVSAEKDILRLLAELKSFGIKFVKVKVGRGDDLKRLRLVRRIMGDEIDMRIDANCAWTVKETLDTIEKLNEFTISAIEQPVKTQEELNTVAKKTSIPIIADESVCSLEEAKKLKNVILDIRLSKCGGILKSLELVEHAQKNNMKCMLGCHIGESGILSAAGRHFACGVDDLVYLEGSYNRFLLKYDVTKEDLTFGRGGVGKPISGYGLGVEVNYQNAA